MWFLDAGFGGKNIVKRINLEQTMNEGLPVINLPVSGENVSDLVLPVTISARFLLGIYAVLPLCLLAMLADRLFWSDTLSSALPKTPESFFVFQLLFGTPHIIASSVILFTNGDYLRAYSVRLTIFTLLILLFFGIGSLYIPFNVFLALVGAATVIHVIKQQVGIGKGLCRLSGAIYHVWGWSLIVFGSILYYSLYTDGNYSSVPPVWVHTILWLLAGLIMALTLACHSRIKTGIGRLYLWSNALMVLQSGLFYSQGYSFLAILGPRLVHDITAFTFYLAHDLNRHRAEPQNLLYRLASKLRLGIFWVCPLVAMLLTYLIGRFADPVAEIVLKPVLGYHLPYATSFLFIGYLGLIHYYTESFTWRQDSPYRRHLILSVSPPSTRSI